MPFRAGCVTCRVPAGDNEAHDSAYEQPPPPAVRVMVSMAGGGGRQLPGAAAIAATTEKTGPSLVADSESPRGTRGAAASGTMIPAAEIVIKWRHCQGHGDTGSGDSDR